MMSMEEKKISHREVELIYNLNSLSKTSIFYLKEFCELLKDVRNSSGGLTAEFVEKTVFHYIDSYIDDILIAVSSDELISKERRDIDLFFSLVTSLSRGTETPGGQEKNKRWSIYQTAIQVIIRQSNSAVHWIVKFPQYLILFLKISDLPISYSKLFLETEMNKVKLVRIISMFKALGLVSDCTIDTEKAVRLTAKGMRLASELRLTVDAQ